MPIWITELARWLGVTSDSKRPNVGALLVAFAAVLLAMGYTPDDVGGFGAKLGAMVTKLSEFVVKPDNAIAIGVGGLGYLMTRGKNGTDLGASEVAALRAELAALKIRRELALGKQEALDLDEPGSRP
jgi:hypothetical protein